MDGLPCWFIPYPTPAADEDDNGLVARDRWNIIWVEFIPGVGAPVTGEGDDEDVCDCGVNEDVWDWDCEDANEFRGAFGRVVEGVVDAKEFAGFVGKFWVVVDDAREFAGFVGKFRVVVEEAKEFAGLVGNVRVVEVDVNDERGFGKPWCADAGLEANEFAGFVGNWGVVVDAREGAGFVGRRRFVVDGVEDAKELAGFVGAL